MQQKLEQDPVDAPRYATLDDLWRPPAPHAGRPISARSRGAGRGTLVGGAIPRELPCESALEVDALTVLLARPDVVDVDTQPPPVEYVDKDGKVRKKTFNSCVRFSDGRRILFEVKPEERAERHGWREQIASFAAQDRGTADGYGLITDRCLPPHVVHNARLVRSAQRCADPALDAVVREIIAEIDGDATIDEIVARSARGGDAFRAVARLVGAGEITLTKPGRIDYGARVKRAVRKETLQ